MKRRRLSRHRLGKALTVSVVASVFLAGCGGAKEPVSVTITSNPPIRLKSEPLEYQGSEGKAWFKFKHDLTIENTNDRPIVISSLSVVPTQFIGDNKLLMIQDQCGVNPPAADGKLPTVFCTSMAPPSIDLEPHASAKFRTVYAHKGLSGMPTLTAGDYTADANISWIFADEAEWHPEVAKMTYHVK